MGTDIWLVFRFWLSLFVIGLAGYPLTRFLFRYWWDDGYFFTKSVGLVFVSYFVWLLASLYILPFEVSSIVFIMFAVFIGGVLLLKSQVEYQRAHTYKPQKLFPSFYAQCMHRLFSKRMVLIVIEELFFFAALYFWAWVKGHEPSIHGLEKFMDYGFAKSTLNSQFFPPMDMWYAGWNINYYYFGHYVMALISRLSFVDLRYGFNLMLATLFAFTFTMSFSIGFQLIVSLFGKRQSEGSKNNPITAVNVPDKPQHVSLPPIHKWKVNIVWDRNVIFWCLIGGILTAYLVTFAGNMQTLYAFTKGYTGENVKPFWELLWSWDELSTQLQTGMNIYWYANATRFIPFTIHEFPSYSFVVSDVHGHVLSLPFVLLAIAMVLQIFGGIFRKSETTDYSIGIVYPLVFGLLAAVLFMTNVLDAPIYMGLFFLLTFFCLRPYIFRFSDWSRIHWFSLPMVFIAGPAILPFVMKFKSFVSGLAVNCPPATLVDRKIGFFLFETIDKCQKSPFWMMYLLWGLFLYCGVWLLITNYQLRIKNYGNVETGRQKFHVMREYWARFSSIEKVLVIFFLYSILLIIFPEFFYFKDIYPQHFRSNTMFKLGYQAFIMFSIVAGYAIVKILSYRHHVRVKNFKFVRFIFILFLLPQLFLVVIYPNFSIKSYFGPLGQYKTLDGLAWFRLQYPNDYDAVNWLAEKISRRELPAQIGQNVFQTPVIVEADSDSYTDYARVSAYTGAPTVVGWAVHEWLWHGTYDIVAPRRDDVLKIYEDPDIGLTEKLLAKYNVAYIFVGQLEREKYKNLDETKIGQLGTVIYSSGDTKIYRVNTI